MSEKPKEPMVKYWKYTQLRLGTITAMHKISSALQYCESERDEGYSDLVEAMETLAHALDQVTD